MSLFLHVHVCVYKFMFMCSSHIAGVMNITLSYSGPVGAFCAGQTFADVLAQGPGCKAEVRFASVLFYA